MIFSSVLIFYNFHCEGTSSSDDLRTPENESSSNQVEINAVYTIKTLYYFVKSNEAMVFHLVFHKIR